MPGLVLKGVFKGRLNSASRIYIGGSQYLSPGRFFLRGTLRGGMDFSKDRSLEKPSGIWGSYLGIVNVCPEYPCAWVTLSPCGDTLIACGETGSRWDWYLGDSLVQSGPDTVLGVGGPGTYRVVVHLDPECPYQRPDTAMIGVPPRMEHDATVFLCAGDTLDLQGEPVTEPGHYTVHLTSHQGCDSIVHVEVVVLSMPAWQTVWDTVVAPGVEITLPGPEAAHYIYEWIPSAGLSCASCPQPAWTADSSQTWVLTVSDTAGCDTMSLAFRVRLAIGMVEVPNLFTPNGDGVNDMFRPVIQAGTGEGIRYAAMRVYSRWGEEVYAGGGTSPSWDGTHMGKACPSDVYGWILEVEYPGGRREVLRGEVTLMR